MDSLSGGGSGDDLSNANVQQHQQQAHSQPIAQTSAHNSATQAAVAFLAAAQQQSSTTTGTTTTNHNNNHNNNIGPPSDMSGPILYTEPNRTSAIDDVRSGVLYIFIVTVFVSFFLILPGIRNDKLPTFLCITTSLLVTSIILIGLFGTTWHVGEAPQISAAYKAFSRDRIQGELSVNIGLQSVNITLRAHKYYIMHEAEGPIILLDSRMMTGPDGLPAANKRSSLLASFMPVSPVVLPMRTEKEETNDDSDDKNTGVASKFININNHQQQQQQQQQPQSVPSNKLATSSNGSLADELLNGNTSDDISVDTELETEEVFGEQQQHKRAADGAPSETSMQNDARRLVKSSNILNNNNSNNITSEQSSIQQGQRNKRDSYYNQPTSGEQDANNRRQRRPKYTVRRVNHVDINYNERFYWIEPQQMRREHQRALERGLPYPILTVVEYLSQDEAGFNWSRQYRLAGYYVSILLWLSAGLCALMFCLHCAAPKYGIYTMQLLGCLLLFTNLTYSLLVPRGDKELVIPFEGQTLTFKFGLCYWLVLIGGCISLTVGTIIVIIDMLFPDFIFTTVLDVDYDSHQDYYMKQKYLNDKRSRANHIDTKQAKLDMITSAQKKPELPPFLMKKKSLIARRSGNGSGDEQNSYDKKIVKTNSDGTTTPSEIKIKPAKIWMPNQNLNRLSNGSDTHRVFSDSSAIPTHRRESTLSASTPNQQSNILSQNSKLMVTTVGFVTEQPRTECTHLSATGIDESNQMARL